MTTTRCIAHKLFTRKNLRATFVRCWRIRILWFQQRNHSESTIRSNTPDCCIWCIRFTFRDGWFISWQQREKKQSNLNNCEAVFLRTCSFGLSASECQKYAIVHERIGGANRPTVVCSGSLRTRVVYLSETNSVVIETFAGATVDRDDVTDDVVKSERAADKTRFLLKYQGT